MYVCVCLCVCLHICWRGLEKQGSDSDNQQEHVACQGEGVLLMYIRLFTVCMCVCAYASYKGSLIRVNAHEKVIYHFAKLY